MPSTSLRARLLMAVGSVIGVVWLAVLVMTYRDSHRGLDEILDGQLASSAQLLVAQSAHELEELEFDDEEFAGSDRQRIAFQIWERGRTLVLRSAGAPTTLFSSVESGLSDGTADGKHWRVFSQWDRDRRVLVQVAEDHALRERLAMRVAMRTTLPLLVGVPVIALVLGWAISRALRPVTSLGHEVAKRGPTSLDPIAAAGVPSEIEPLVERLNELFGRVQRSFEQERRFTANAAHELRTPLAALRVQAELARDSHDAAVARGALDQVIHACDRLTRLISQLLLLARVDGQAAAKAPCRLDHIARDLIAEIAPAAIAAGQEIALAAPQPVELVGNAPLLSALLRNLIDNALRHGGAPLRVDVAIEPQAQMVLLRVADDGSGVAADALGELGTPFSRPAGTRAEGSGLGLALVHRIAEWHGGTASISHGANGRGFQVTVTLPAHAA